MSILGADRGFSGKIPAIQLFGRNPHVSLEDTQDM